MKASTGNRKEEHMDEIDRAVQANLAWRRAIRGAHAAHQTEAARLRVVLDLERRMSAEALAEVQARVARVIRDAGALAPMMTDDGERFAHPPARFTVIDREIDVTVDSVVAAVRDVAAAHP